MRYLILAGVWVCIIFAYIILTASMPVIVEMANTANTSMSATSNMSDYPGMLEATLATPLVLWFVPFIIGVIVTVGILKFDWWK